MSGAAVVVGGLNEQNQLKAIRAGSRVLIATPGRLVDFLDRRLVKLAKVHTVDSTKPTACWTWASCR